jgi:hypothetical protein
MALDFPASPTVGSTFSSGGRVWQWDGAKWVAASTSGSGFLPLSGGTMTGPIVLSADPAAALQPATKQYVDAVRIGENRIINGDMWVDQRNNGASSTGTGIYTCDKWIYGTNQANKFTWQRAPAGPALLALGVGYYFAFASNSAYTPAAIDTFQFMQYIESDMVTDFAWGTANAAPLTLSFWAYSSMTGNFGGAIRNSGATRSYPFIYNIPVASVWTKIAVTIPGDTAGTWLMTGNGVGIAVGFDLGSGSSSRGAAGFWTSSNYLGANGAVSVVAVNGAAFNIAGVKVEIGNYATPFVRGSLAKALADCQRYYERSYDLGVATGAINNIGAVIALSGVQPSGVQNVAMSAAFKTTKRATPNVIVYSTVTGAAGKVRDAAGAADVNTTNLIPSQTGLWVTVSGVTTTAYNYQFQWVANADL